MKGTFFSLSAAGCTAFMNLCLRKSSENSTPNHSPSGYLLVYYLVSFVLGIAFTVEIWKTSINYTMLCIGMAIGLINAALLFLTSYAIKEGPTGLTFAFQTGSTIFPGLFLYLLLGSDFGFSCSFLQLIGMGLVLIGLFLGTTKKAFGSSKTPSKWFKYILGCVLLQAICLTIIQGRCVLFDYTGGSSDSFFSNFYNLTQADDIWLIPGQFGISLFTAIVACLWEHKTVSTRELVCGSFGGILNFATTTLILLSTKVALPEEKGILFPCYAVGSLILCNIWSTLLYKEPFNFKSNALCSLGIFAAVIK